MPPHLPLPLEITVAPWIFFAVAALCVVLVGVAKAGFGGGVGVLATPLMALVVPPIVAAGLLLPLLCACDLVSLWHYRSRFHSLSIRRLLPGALAGIVAGWLLLWIYRGDRATMNRALEIAIGLIAILFVIWQLIRARLLAHLSERKPGAFQGGLLGLIAGFASMLAHAGGPPVTIYILQEHLDRRVFVGTTVVFFSILNYTKLVPYTLLGMIELTNLRVSLLLLPLVPVGVWLGLYLNRRIRQDWFMRIIYVILLVTGIQLLLDVNLIALISGNIG